MTEYVSPVRRAADAAGRRYQALRLAIESYAGLGVPTDSVIEVARKFEAYLWPEAPAPRPHHPCARKGCVTPSGKTACHTCGEAWPCSKSEPAP